MGTRSITIVRDESNNKIAEIYQQYDGMPSGVGFALLDFIESGTLVNGFQAVEDRQFNGMGCFVAQLIEEFKDGVGGLYLYAPTKINKRRNKYAELYGVEYCYEIDSKLNIRCWGLYNNKEIDLYKISREE